MVLPGPPVFHSHNTPTMSTQIVMGVAGRTDTVSFRPFGAVLDGVLPGSTNAVPMLYHFFAGCTSRMKWLR